MPRPFSFNFINLLCIVAFIMLALNFVTPTLNFMASMIGQTQTVASLSYISQLMSILPLMLTGMFFSIVLKETWITKERRTRFLWTLQATSASGVFVIWLLRTYSQLLSQLDFPLNFTVDFLPIVFVMILYSGWLLVISSRIKDELNLQERHEALYLSVNLVFAASILVHLFKSVDFFYYFDTRLPFFLIWIFNYAPTLLVSLMSLSTWVTLLLTNKNLRKLIPHFVLLVLPVILLLYAMTLRPLIGYVLTSAIVWGSSYEFFYPQTLSLPLVLSATTAFISSSILLGSIGRGRNPNLIRLSIATAVLAGMSLSPTSTIGIALSLQFLLQGMMPRHS